MPIDLSIHAQSYSDLYRVPVNPIPSLPPCPEYPVPHIIDSDVQDYIVPLYSRAWFMAYRYKKGFVNTDRWYRCATLSRNYNFKTFGATMDFVTEVARLSQTEDVSSISLPM